MQKLPTELQYLYWSWQQILLHCILSKLESGLRIHQIDSVPIWYTVLAHISINMVLFMGGEINILQKHKGAVIL